MERENRCRRPLTHCPAWSLEPGGLGLELQLARVVADDADIGLGNPSSAFALISSVSVTLVPLLRCNSATSAAKMDSNAFTGRTMSISTDP